MPAPNTTVLHPSTITLIALDMWRPTDPDPELGKAYIAQCLQLAASEPQEYGLRFAEAAARIATAIRQGVTC